MDSCIPTIWFPREINGREPTSFELEQWRITYAAPRESVGLQDSKIPDDPSSEKG